MKKFFTLLFLFFSLYLSISQVQALTWVDNNGAKNCNNDPLDNTSGQKRIPQTNNVSAASSGTTPCEFHGYYGGEWSGWMPLGSDAVGNHYTCPDQGYASQIEYNAANTQYRVFCKYRDDVAPSITDIGSLLPSGFDRLATATETFQVNVGENGGSPIALIQGYLEETDTNNTYYPIESDSDKNPANTGILRINNWDIRNVDNFGSNGERTYTAFISYIADEAGNSLGILDNSNPASSIVRYDYSIYANTFNIGTRSASSNLNSAVNVADGSPKNVNISLVDAYGNKIIPVPSISRTIDFEFNIDNYLRRNQYVNTGNDTALYIDNLSNSVGVGAARIENLNDEPSPLGDGVYSIPFYVFAPTNIASSYVPGNANINSITADINGTIGSVSDIMITGSSIPVRAKPLYITQFTGDIFDTGFIEGSNQNNILTITKDSASPVSISSPSVRMEFGTGSTNLPNPDYNISINSSSLGNEGHQVSFSNVRQVSSSFSDYIFSSFMTQQQAVTGQNHSYLASIVKYDIDIGGTNRSIIYPYHTLGKNSYFGSTTSGLNSYQGGIKVIGNTSTSQEANEIITGQFENDVRIFENFTKSTQRKDIEQNVYKVIRYVNPKSAGTLTIGSSDLSDVDWSNSKFDIGNVFSRGTSLYNKKVLYYGDLGGSNVVITGNTSNIEGEKTIVVEGGNLYINGDIENSDSDGILGIIVLGGNIYIHPSVRDIEAVLYTNQSVISYNGVELDGNNSDVSDLANQLYIYGSLFSENTIGGSRKSVPECPYYINTGCTSLQEAQKFDLNYLRRYFMYDSNSDGIVDTIANSGNQSDGGGGYLLNPIVIEYNPLVQQTPPPFFD